MNLPIPPLFFAVATFAMVTNVLWYRAKFLLRSRGYPMSYIRHFQDLRHLRQLINAESDANLRQHYSRLQSALYVSIAITLCLFVTFFVSSFPK